MLVDIPKDAGVREIKTLLALCSAITGQTVKKGIAMTGEVTLRGRVLPIGGLKEKALAALRVGITHVILPKDNEKDLVEIPEEMRSKLTFHPVSHMDEVLALTLGSLKKPPEQAKD